MLRYMKTLPWLILIAYVVAYGCIKKEHTAQTPKAVTESHDGK